MSDKKEKDNKFYYIIGTIIVVVYIIAMAIGETL